MPYKDKLKQKENHRAWHVNNRERILLKQKAYRSKVKLLVYSKYCEGDIKCQCCGERHLEFLSIDHVDGGGTRLRKEHGRAYLYYWLVKNNFPEGYRILCHNCNQAYATYGKCPHLKHKMRDSYSGSTRPSQG